MKEKRINIFWFRRDLRLEDNKGLYDALNSGKSVLPIFIFDRNILDILEDRSDHRVTFIHQTIENLNDQITKTGSSLITFYDKPENVFKKLVAEYNIDKVFTNSDYEPYALDRDEKVKSLLHSHQIEFISSKDHVIFEKNEVTKDDGLPYTVFTPYKRKWLATLEEQGGITTYSSKDHIGQFIKQSSSKVISLDQMNFSSSAIKAPPLNIHNEIIKSYDQTRNFPGNTKGTSKLGVHLRFGTVSIRKMAKVGERLNETYLSELVWRDFYHQIVFNFPHVATTCFRKKYEVISWENNEDDFDKWCNGQTGYPLVDAGMRELNTTGYMHNRVRMVVASFLTKHLLIDYRWGEAYFAQKLFDFDLASNNGGWQWAAGCGTDAAPYFRVFNPTSQLEKFDKNLVYTKKWVPEFGTFEYTRPIVDHKAARLRCLDRYKEALNG